MWYNVDFYILAVDLMITSIRKKVMIAFAKAFVKPFVTIHAKWLQQRKSDLFILAHNGQVCYMRGALNDIFDPSLRRIYIDGTGGDANRNYIFVPAEQRPRYLGTMYLRQPLELADDGADFYVYVPAEIMATQSFEVNAQINLYRLGGKRYLIILI